MFGQQPNNTPFGGGFGQPQQQQQQQQQQAPFGSPPPVSGGLFGQPSTTPAFGSTAFGQPAPAPAAFGSTGAFGSPAPSAFGAPAPATGLFGQPAPAPTAFGGSTAFGTSSASAFGASAPSTSIFGQPSAPAPAAFGSTGFGSQPAPAPGLFGAPAPSFSPFGAAPVSTFGQPAQAPSLFGSPAPAPATSLFGSPAPAPTGFGTSLGFGAPAPSAFGAPTPPSTGMFGAPASSAFGQTSSTGMFGGGATSQTGPGTSGTMYQVTAKQDGTSSINLQSITAMPQYENKSHEELRYEDYQQGNKGSSTPQAGNNATGFGFGSPPAPATGLFGSSNVPFGSTAAPTGGGLFGSTPAPAPGVFGSAPASGGLFGSSAPAPGAGGLFGSTAPAPSTGFGFGSAPASSGFGSTNSGGLFGSPAPAPASGGFFGNTTPAPALGFGAAPAQAGFGSNPAQGAFGAAPAGGLFGSAAPTPGSSGLFGSQGTTQFNAFGGFGSSSAPSTFGNAPASGGLFGNAPASSVGGGLFGSSAPAPSAFGFGQPSTAFGGQPQPGFGSGPPAPQQQQPQPLFSPTMQIIPSATNEIIEQKLRAMENQKKELEKMEAWQGGSPSTGTVSTPTSLYSSEVGDGGGFFSPVLRSTSLSTTPRSSAKIRPRGFPRSEPTNKHKTLIAIPRRNNSGMMSPEASIQANNLNLVIREGSLQRPRKFASLKLDVATENPDFTETIQPLPVDNDDDKYQHTNADSKIDRIIRPDPTPSPSPNRGHALLSSPDVHQQATTKSPGYDYYQQVIGNSTPTSSQPNDSSLLSPSLPEASLVPKLTKHGYQVTPSLDELSKMSEADLASVRGFSVSRPGYGMVEWEGAVDVREANLDRVVVIEPKDVSVYSQDEEEGTKPDEGSKLNRPSKITFYDVFPKKGPNASDLEKEAFAIKIEKTTNKIDAEFLSYDKSTGVWKIRVLHFSRYGFIEDDSEGENFEFEHDSAESQNVQSPGISSSPQLQFDHVVHKSAIHRTSRIIMDDLDVSQSSETPEKMLDFVSDVDVDAMDVDEIARSLVKKTIPITQRYSNQRSIFEEVATFEDVGQNNSFLPGVYVTVNDLQPTEDELKVARNMKSICSQLEQEVNYTDSQIDVDKRIGRSFRVGWLPNGSFIQPKEGLDTSTSMVIRHPVLSKVHSQRNTTSVLEAQLHFAKICADADGCPLFSLCSDDQHVTSTFTNPRAIILQKLANADNIPNEAKITFTLLSNLAIEKEEPCITNKTPLAIRHIEAAQTFLRELSSSDDTKESSTPYDHIFEALAAGDTAKAFELATNARLDELAFGLASGTVSQVSFSKYYKSVLSSSDISSLVNSSALRIICALGGNTANEDRRFATGDDSLDWHHRLGLRLQHSQEISLSQTLRLYENDIIAGKVPYPSPKYNGNSSACKSLFYQLLKLCVDPASISVCEAVDPRGFTPYLHDFGFSFHLIGAICATKLDRRSRLSELQVEYILNGFEAQLVKEGQWHWAVFVALCQIGPESLGLQQLKSLRAKELIIRHFDPNDPQFEEKSRFLDSQVGIPSEWLNEALCYRFAHTGNGIASIKHALLYDETLAGSMLMESLLPAMFFELSGESRLRWLQEIAEDSPADSVARVVYDFLDFEERIMAVAHKEVEPSFETCEDLKYVYSTVQSSMQTWVKQHDGTTASLLCPSPNKKIPFSTLASEILDRLDKLKKYVDYNCNGSIDRMSIEA